MRTQTLTGVLLVLSLTVPDARSQDTACPVLTYMDGGLKQETLPFNKKFILRGSALLPAGRSKLVSVRIVPRDQHPAIWRPSSGADTNNFEFLIAPLTNYDEQDTLVLQFFLPGDKATIRNAVTSIVESAKHRLLSSPLSIVSLDTVNEYLKCAVLDFNKNSTATKFSYFDAKDSLVLGLPVKDIAGSIGKEIFYLVNTNTIDRARKEKDDTLRAIQMGHYDALFEALSKMSHKAGARFTPSDVDRLRTLSKQPLDTMSAERHKKFAAQFGRTEEDYTKSVDSSLKSLIFHVDKLSRLQEHLNAAVQRRTRFDDVLDSLANNLRTFYEAESIEITTKTVYTKAEIDRFMIGTMYGFGAVFLGCTSTRADAFSYVGLKFYFGPVDYSSTIPYPTCRSHFAITVSAVLASDITYKGQKQTDFSGGIKPLVGLSLDINPKIVFNAGIMLFRQPNINPLATNATTPKTAFYMGLCLDFDAFNRLRGLLKPS